MGGGELRISRVLSSCWHSKNTALVSPHLCVQCQCTDSMTLALWEHLCNGSTVAFDSGRNHYAVELGKASN